MKLYLSSVGIPDKEVFASLLPTKSANVAFIANAWDIYPTEKAEPFVQGRLRELEKMGCKIYPIDLRNISDIAVVLKELDAVWITGGNSFYLNWLMGESGFDRAIKPLVEAGLVYGGESAGAVVAGTTLRGVELMDDPTAAQKVIWNGLNLVDFGMVPHWNNPKYTEALQQIRTEMKKHTNSVRTINDGECIVIDRAAR